MQRVVVRNIPPTLDKHASAKGEGGDERVERVERVEEGDDVEGVRCVVKGVP